jgi:hypothetical protein
MDPSDSHSSLLDNNTRTVFRLNSTGTGSLTWKRERKKEDFYSETKTFILKRTYRFQWDWTTDQEECGARARKREKDRERKVEREGERERERKRARNVERAIV